MAEIETTETETEANFQELAVVEDETRIVRAVITGRLLTNGTWGLSFILQRKRNFDSGYVPWHFARHIPSLVVLLGKVDVKLKELAAELNRKSAA